MEKIFDSGITLSHKIPQVEPLLMEGLKYAEDLHLSSVGLREQEICELRDKLLTAIHSAVIPLTAYCHEYDRHAPLYSLDVDEFIQ